MVLITSWVAASVITSPAVLPRASPTGSVTEDDDCDGRHICKVFKRMFGTFKLTLKVFCPPASGTCYTGDDGYIGCCSK